MNAIQFAGRFKLVASKADGSGRRELTDWFDNLITDAGLNSLGGNTNLISQCAIGSGSSVPAVTNTALDAQYAETNNRTGQSGASEAAPWYSWFRFRFRFAVGVASGNVSEIGIVHGGVLWSRTLVKDPQGNSTTITVLSDEVLDVYYELRIFPPENDVVGNFSISDGTNTTNHVATIRAASASSQYWAQGFFNGLTDPSSTGAQSSNGTDLGLVTGSFGSNTATQITSITNFDFSWFAYVNNSMKRRVRITLGLDAHNYAAGIGGMDITLAFGKYQAKFAPSILKTNQMVLRLDFELSWARRNIA